MFARGISALLALVFASAAGAAPPQSFAARVDNPWFPLEPGTTFVYKGVKDGEPTRDVVTVTHRTKLIQGVRCTVVDDRLYVRGRLAERTDDWYAQDSRGAVWYFGEATAELDAKGKVTTTEGSWQAGRDGAKAGIYMPAHPKVGQTFRQEYYAGHAEDRFRIVALTKARLTTREWTPLEPGVVGRKVYKRGVGMVEERDLQGGDERSVLVDVRRA
jgi:hypothetical protein